MDKNSLDLRQIIPRILLAVVAAHVVYFVTMTLLINAIPGLIALIFLPVVVTSTAVVFIIALRKLVHFSYKTIGLGLCIALLVTLIIEIAFQPQLYSGDGSTLSTASIFYPGMMWDNNFEFLLTYPLTYLISVAFNYLLLLISMLASKMILNKARSNWL